MMSRSQPRPERVDEASPTAQVLHQLDELTRHLERGAEALERRTRRVPRSRVPGAAAATT